MERRDPVVRALLDHADRTAPPRPGEQIHISRFQGGVVDYERQDYGALAPSVAALITWLTRPLAWSFTVTSTPEVWGPFFEYLAFTHITDLSVGRRTFVLYGMDWRRLPVDVWMDLMNDRERTGTTGPAPASLLRPAPLGREAFAAAVRTALRNLHRDDRLAANPLMGTRLAQGPSGPSADVCRSQLRRAVACIGRQPRGAAPRPRPHLRAAGPHPGGRGGGPGPAVQHLPPAPGRGGRRPGRPALGRRDRRGRPARRGRSTGEQRLSTI
jgi:hypothetical protein